MTDIGDPIGNPIGGGAPAGIPGGGEAGGDPLRLEAWKWVLRLTSGDATREDIAALTQWREQSPLHADAFAQASGAWRSFGLAAANVAGQDNKMAASRTIRRRPVLARRAFLGGALAASTAAVALAITEPPLGLWPSLGEFAADYRTAPGEQRQISLPGSGSIEMNTRTSLNLRTQTDQGGNVELITGEATIVTGVQPIAVIAAKGKAWADSARFNMRYDGADVCVTCIEGLVHVGDGGRSVILQQSQQISYTRQGLGQMTTVDPTVVVGWRQGDLFFQNEPLSHVIDEVNRYRPGKIVLINKGLGTRRVTARFKLDRLDVILTQLKESFGAQLTTLPGDIVLVS